MSLARTLLLRASRSPWLAEQFRRRAFARRAVRRFMPGEDQGSALDAAADFAVDRIGTVFTSLGERVSSPAEAAAVREHYLGLFEQVRARGLPSHVSVKLTHLGLDVDGGAACADHLLALAERAAAVGSMLWIDMEESFYVDRTLDLFARTRARHASVGVCLQSYLRRTPADVDRVLALDGAIRLVKGAYSEPPEVAFPKKGDTDAAYAALAERLVDHGARGGAVAAFGTHDMALVARIRERAESLGVPRAAYEFHLLYGIRADEQRLLAGAGHAVRVLISYGSAWFPWYMRRLAERPANVWFVLKNMV